MVRSVCTKSAIHLKNELLKVVVPSAITGFLYNPLSELTGLFI